MSVTLQNASEIPVSGMKDGQLAQISSGFSAEYIGQIVQRFENRLIRIGKYCGGSWPDMFSYPPPRPSFKVCLLREGDQIVIVNNQTEGVS